MDYNKLCIHCMRETTVQAGEACPHCGRAVGVAPELTHQLKPLTILRGKYLIGDVLGEGGFGITYIGLDLNLEIRVAVKEFYPNGYATRESASTSSLTIYSGGQEETVRKWRENFLKEAKSLAKCAHMSGVVGVRDYFQENNTAYLVMEYVEGVTLKEYQRQRGGRIAAAELLPAMEPVFKALGEVHRQGLIHRDISPDNIMLLSGRQMKLLDFGAAREYEADEKSLSVMLKPGYAPEEQYRSRGNQGPWSDIYALAGTIYKCLTGITPPEALERLRQDELVRPNEGGAGLSAGQESALIKALAVRAEDRYQTVEAFRQDLYAPGQSGLQANVVSQPPVEKTVYPAPEQSRDAKRQNKTAADGKSGGWQKVLIAALLVAVIVILAAGLGQRRPDRAAKRETVQANSQQENIQQEDSMQESAPVQADAPASEDTAVPADEPASEDTAAPADESASIPEAYRSVYTAVMERYGIDESTAADRFVLRNEDFAVNENAVTGYGRDMEYDLYDSGIADFSFYYPTDMYNAVICGSGEGEALSDAYGSMERYIHFLGSDRSELLYSIARREDGMSLQDMVDYVYFTEAKQMTDAVKLVSSVDDSYDHGRMILTGFNSDRSLLIYDLFKIEHEYVLQMKVIFPQYTDDFDKMTKDYFTECVYRLCEFSGNTKEFRSFAEYMEAVNQ